MASLPSESPGAPRSRCPSRAARTSSGTPRFWSQVVKVWRKSSAGIHPARSALKAFAVGFLLGSMWLCVGCSDPARIMFKLIMGLFWGLVFGVVRGGWLLASQWGVSRAAVPAGALGFMAGALGTGVWLGLEISANPRMAPELASLDPLLIVFICLGAAGGGCVAGFVCFAGRGLWLRFRQQTA